MGIKKVLSDIQIGSSVYVYLIISNFVPQVKKILLLMDMRKSVNCGGFIRKKKGYEAVGHQGLTSLVKA